MVGGSGAFVWDLVEGVQVSRRSWRQAGRCASDVIKRVNVDIRKIEGQMTL